MLLLKYLNFTWIKKTKKQTIAEDLNSVTLVPFDKMITFIYSLCFAVRGLCHGACMEVREQVLGIVFFLPPCKTWDQILVIRIGRIVRDSYMFMLRVPC